MCTESQTSHTGNCLGDYLVYLPSQCRKGFYSLLADYHQPPLETSSQVSVRQPVPLQGNSDRNDFFKVILNQTLETSTQYLLPLCALYICFRFFQVKQMAMRSDFKTSHPLSHPPLESINWFMFMSLKIYGV